MYVRREGGYGAFPLMTEVTSIHAPKIMKNNAPGIRAIENQEDITMKTVMMRNLEIGTGAPKVIVPIVAKDAAGIAAKGAELKNYTMDVVEWRVDFYDDVFEIPKVIETAKALREALGETPVLFTFRTKKEGGEKEIDMETYTALNKAVAESGYVDAVDVEIFSGDDVVLQNIANIHAAGKVVVGFNLTMPDKNDMALLVDELSPAAKISGAVNTVVNDNGRLTGHTTDGIGWMRSALDAGVDPVGKKMVQLGAGGAGTAILVQAAIDGVKEIDVFNAHDGFCPRLAPRTLSVFSVMVSDVYDSSASNFSAIFRANSPMFPSM